MFEPTEGTDQITEPTAEVAAPDAGTGPVDAGGFNPAWAPIKEKLGDPHFQLIKDELAGWDRGVQKRFEDHSKQLSAYTALGTPEELTQYRTIVDNLNAEPERMYEALGQFLRDNGRMPTAAEAEDIADEVEEDEAREARDPRIDQIAEQQARMEQFLQQQQMERIQQETDAQVNKEFETLASARGYSEEDLAEIARIAVAQMQTTGKPASLEAAADHYDGLRNRFLSAPRAGDSAPRLLPTNSGGSPQSVQRSVGALSRNETQDLVANLLSGGKG